MLGGEEGDEVFASTFHSACVRILRRWAEEIGYPRSFTIYDTDDSQRVMKTVYKELSVDDKFFPVKSAINQMSRWKDQLVSPAEAAANPSDYWFKFEVNSANGNPFYDSASVGYLIQLNGGQYAWNPSANGSFNTYGNWCTVRLELSEVATNGINAGWNNLFWIMQPNSDWNTDHSFANIRIEKKQ